MHAFHKALIVICDVIFCPHSKRFRHAGMCTVQPPSLYTAISLFRGVFIHICLRFAHCGIVARFRDSLHLNRGSTVSIHLLPQTD